MAPVLQTPPSKTSPINIVGAGIFGLSTALNLAERGYSNVCVFDRQPYDETEYSYLKGADAASADINKIIRSAYGGVSIYQELSLEAIDGWEAWNHRIASGSSVPPGMTASDRVFIPNGNLIMTDSDILPAFDLASVQSMEAAGHKDTQLITTDPRHLDLARSRGFAFALDPFRREEKGKSNVAVLDTTGGTAVADKACRFALHEARKLGVRFMFGPEIGALDSLCYESDSRTKVNGLRTTDGKTHPAAMTILACGGWTPSILPRLDGFCEATAGSVFLIKVPRESKLWSRLSSDNFPSWQYKMRDGSEGGLYGFALDDQGFLKIGYRGTKYTNPITQVDGKERSVPVTRWSTPTSDGKTLTSIPQQAFTVVQRFLKDHLPELADEGLDITTTRVCWYNDSFDNHLLVDRVPEVEGLMVATAGSGHAFKYLPVIGKYVADVMEFIDLERPSIQAWKWREQGSTAPANILMEGSSGKRALGNIPLISDASFGTAAPKSRL
ncbi:putative sarcosine oxidase [Polychaeton citri CBS 116435]|uniref:Sarcosine oxidase n=1 Tax=Polychaeton citri CBS 116435 TaxID=1314669 RepID=A0A9P4QCB6_9PEZI|nr:putative sarcosine oxidase [Polychaeton citri CBS 116435]